MKNPWSFVPCVVICLYPHRQVVGHLEGKKQGRKTKTCEKNLSAILMCSGELRNDHFPFRWDISSFLLTCLSLPWEATWMPRDVILPGSAASPSSPFLPGSLSSGSQAQSHWPGLGLLSWPPWWVAVTCGFFLCLIPSVHLLPSPPIPGLSWTTAFVSRLAVSFLTPFCSRFNSHPPAAALLKHKARPLFLVGDVGECV